MESCVIEIIESGKSPKSLMRMFSPGGNPRTQNLFAIIVCPQRHEGVQFRVESVSEQKHSDMQANIQQSL